VNIKSYNPEKYDFCKYVALAFEVPLHSLDKLHKLRKDLLPQEALTFNTETKTQFHKVFYSYLHSSQGREMQSKYDDFIKSVISPLFSENFLYQKFPSFRVHLPDEKAIHKWHYDSDADHKHPLWEINFQIALTKMFDSNAMWIESAPGIKDHKPVELEVGQFAIFDGNRCEHGNKPNGTNKTRVSMDFRVLPYKKYKEQELHLLESVTSNRKFKIGGYYNLYEK